MDVVFVSCAILINELALLLKRPFVDLLYRSTHKINLIIGKKINSMIVLSV